jgi:hypothetical protein
VEGSRAIAKCKSSLPCPTLESMTNRDRLGRYVGPRTEHLELIAPGLKYNTGRGLQMALEVGAATAGSMSGMHCELVDIRGAYFPRSVPVVEASGIDLLTL